jgi:carbonic anhydrase/acetyltransferase-like protein (isoleucine patch superfamily)
MDDSIVESNSIIAAGSVLPKNTRVPEGSIFAGIPAKKIKDISPKLQKGEIERIAKNYMQYAAWFK